MVRVTAPSEGCAAPEPRCWDRVAGFFTQRKENEASLDESPVPFLQLFRFATSREKILLVIGLLAAAATGILGPSFAVVGGSAVSILIGIQNPIGNDAFLQSLRNIALITCAIGIAAIAFAIIEYLTLTTVAQRICGRIRREFVGSVLAQDAEFLNTTTSGELSDKLNSNIDRLQDGIGDKIGLLIRSVANYVSSMCVAFALNWRLALVMVWIGPIAAFVAIFLPKLSARFMSESMKISGEANGLAEESIMNVKTVASCNGQRSMVERYSALLSRGGSIAIRIGFFNGVSDAFSCSVRFYGFYIAGVWFGTQWLHAGIIHDAGTVLIVVNAAMGSSYILSVLGPHMQAILKARIAAATVYHIIDREPPLDAREESGMDPSSVDGSIEFDSVQFSHPGRPPLLTGLSWSVKEGETVALVGRSGCGKSTSIGLIARLFNVASGEIRLGGVPLHQFNIGQLRKMMGVVSQEPALFNGTIIENIRLGRDLSDDEIEAAAKTANAHDFIMSLDKGYSSILGPSGVSLSGGQKQRVAIARAIAANPRILLLDEATSALDTHSEKIVQAALNKASTGRTTIVVAHRLSTIREVDRIFVIQDGRVVEEGRYLELIGLEGSVFAEMAMLKDFESTKEAESVDLSEASSHEGAKLLENRKEEKEFEMAFPSMDGGIWEVLTISKRMTAVQMVLGVLRGLELVFFVLASALIFRALGATDFEGPLTTGCLIMGAVAVFCAIIITSSRAYSAWFSEWVFSRIRIRCLSSLLHRPLAYFDRASTSPAACSTTLSQQAPMAAPAVDYRALIFYENITPAFALCFFCIAICWQTGCVAVASFFIIISTFYALQKLVSRRTQAFNDVDTSGIAAIEIFENTRTIQLSAAEAYFIESFAEKQIGSQEALSRLTTARAFVHAASQSCYYFPCAAVYALGSYLVYYGTASVEQIYLSNQCLNMMMWPVLMMAPCLVELIGSASAATAIFALIDPTLDELDDDGFKPEIKGMVKAENVSFAYPSRPTKLVTSDLSFAVQPGKSLALVGPSGGGKSTIVNLLERFYEPTFGNMSLDGYALSALNRCHVRSNIALVSQEPVLFAGTVAENVCLGCEDDVSLADVRRVCHMAYAASFIEDFPEGYETPVGEKGNALSGGQKQRIAIARALIRNPKVLLLDEATSALDAQSEEVVKSALERSVEKRTSIVVAHRLDTIRNCDEILFVEHGRVVERGNHQELMEVDGRYADLVREQKLS